MDKYERYIPESSTGFGECSEKKKTIRIIACEMTVSVFYNFLCYLCYLELRTVRSGDFYALRFCCCKEISIANVHI